MTPVTLVPWSRRHTRLMCSWPAETDPLLPLLLLRGSYEPWDVPPSTLAVLTEDGRLVGRFTYRVTRNARLFAFVGLHLNPACRNAGYGVSAMRQALVYLRDEGLAFAWASVAAANRAAMLMNFNAGFSLAGRQDWRAVPEPVDLVLLARLPARTVSLDPPSVLYKQISADLSVCQGGVIGEHGAPVTR